MNVYVEDLFREGCEDNLEQRVAYSYMRWSVEAVEYVLRDVLEPLLDFVCVSPLGAVFLGHAF